ncbi:putative ankyrin repeat domain-containing protein 20A4 [Bombus flavifrons]|uniref:putative ankyrin repeat domain-containing protein 20A4 n=1 Tax=Bombus flavifrons TaxID=103934 RepID=UPI0037047B85
MSTLKAKGCLFLASSLCDGLEDNNIKQVTTLLLNKEANPNTLLPTHGVTPFHLVIGNDSEAFAEEVSKLFLRHGGNPNVRSVDGLTPVHVAAAWGRVTVLELLLANGGDPLCLDDEGRSPFHYAFDGKYYKAIAILGKYCDNSIKEEKTTKYKMTFNKLLINNEDVMAEYIVPQISNISKENMINETIFKGHKDERFAVTKHVNSFNLSYSSISNDNQSDSAMTSAAELRIQEEMDKEKHLINEIINQLSNSLKSNPKEEKINAKYRQCKKILDDTSPSSTISTDNSILYNIEDKFPIKMKGKKRSVTPKSRPQIFSQSSNIKVPITPIYDPNDSIVSKSPNFLINKPIEKGQKYLSPKVLNKEIKFEARTPCIMRTQSFQSEEFNMGKEVARSTPRRRKRYYRQYSSLRKFRRNNELTSSENTSPDTTNSLSPNQNCARNLNYKFNKNLAIRLHENKYDDDIPIDSNENENNIEKCILKKDLTEGLNHNFRNLHIKESDFKEKSEEHLKEYILKADKTCAVQKRFLNKVELKINDTVNTFKENLSTFLSSFKSQSYISVQEEYRYEDPDEGLAFLERRIYTLSPCKTADCISSDKMWPKSLNLSMDTYPTDDALRKELIHYGDNPGPITNTTRQLYLKRLTKLKCGACNPSFFEVNSGSVTNTKRQLYSKQLTKLKCESHNSSSSEVSHLPLHKSNYCEFHMKPFLTFGDWINDIEEYKIIERNAFRDFSLVSPSRKWRDGMNKTCFNYLLLDPRITKDLAFRKRHLTESMVWTTFLSAIFYVGKGTRNRPYSHLKDAFATWVSKKKPENEKIQHILDIWNAGYGVVCLHIFQNSIPVEAFTREAAMIDALGIQKLKNCKSGDYYGIAATWNIEQKGSFGRYLLYQAMHILLCEGERQILPQNL